MWEELNGMKVSKIELDSQKLEQLKRFSQSIFYRLFCHNFLESNSILKIFVSFDSSHFREATDNKFYKKIISLIIIINQKTQNSTRILYLWNFG